MQRHGKFFACRAHGGRSPEIDDQPFRVVAVFLKVPPDQFLGQPHALRIGRTGGHRPWIGGEQVPPGGQHIRLAAIGRSAWAGVNAFAVQCIKQGLFFRSDRRGHFKAARIERGAAPYMQPVSELAFLDVADHSVDARQCFGGTDVIRDPEILFHSQDAGLITDFLLKTVAAFRVKPFGI